jgi:hypothetical protein
VTYHNARFTLLCVYANSCRAARNSFVSSTWSTTQKAGSGSQLDIKKFAAEEIEIECLCAGARECAHFHVPAKAPHSQNKHMNKYRNIKNRHDCTATLVLCDPMGINTMVKIACSLFIWMEIELTFAACNFVCSKFSQDRAHVNGPGEIKILLGTLKVGGAGILLSYAPFRLTH